ncbi:GNAT family protein [Bacillus carboniphilus]|uniref:GNAT family protein n=1 Tax=Bacillus carboniphilus TaxID=86663 RepID=A0ABY9JUD1_9BACI|nr:GNAT family protein [Bacillus carboniphilus]WLR42353.1 GNAT family protein [Bacillus carboniphilus]
MDTHYIFKQITQEQAEHIAYQWHYDGIYSFYDMEADKEDLEEFLDSEMRGYFIFAVTKDNELVGFFSFYKDDPDAIDIGLGMRPDLTGSGWGYSFLTSGIKFAREKYQTSKITLSVATFNERAINVYRKFGFIEVERFMQDTNGSSYEFLKMVYHC